MLDLLSWDTATTFVAGVVTLAIFSFLIRENALYRFFEHLFIGIAAGIGPVIVIRDWLWPKILEPMCGLSIDRFPDGTMSEPYEPAYLLYLIPMAVGLLYYTLYVPRYAWLAKIVIGLSLGAAGAMAIKGFFAEVVPQITSSFKPLIVFSTEGVFDLWGSLSNSIFVLTLILVLNYFFFTFGRENSLQARTAQWGRPLLMICFGAFFGSTVMARLALLVERAQFLIEDWATVVVKLFGG